MGIQISGINDTISASDGSLSLPGADLTTLTQVNVTGVGTFANLVVSGNASIGGTVTYMDVTNVDSVGIITAQQGIQVLANGINIISGVTTVSAGSTAAPSITPSGDSNTGIFFPSADTIAFGEGGAEAARFDSAGRLGIGTDNPSQKLHVRSVIRIDGSTNPYIVLNDGTNTGYIQITDGRLDLNHNGNISFAPGGGVKATINTSGNLVFAGSGQGIDFSATANSSGTMTSELLSDYEEGTWTPTLDARTTNFSSVTYGIYRVGYYTRIGNMVYISCYVSTTAHSGGSGELRISGTPFTITGGAGDPGPPIVCYSNSMTSQYAVVATPFNTALWELYYYTNSGGFGNIQVSNLPQTSYIKMGWIL